MADNGPQNPYLLGPEYDNMDDAASAAWYNYDTLPKDTAEFASLFLRDKKTGKIKRTSFNTDGQMGSANIGDLLRKVPEGYEPVGVMHNHPGGPKAAFPAQYLSTADTNIGRGVYQDDPKADRKRTLEYGQGRTPTGPLQMYLLAGNKDPRVGTGKMDNVFSLANQGSRVSMKLQNTEGFIGEVPIAEIKQRIMMRIANGNMPADVKARILEGMRQKTNLLQPTPQPPMPRNF